MRDENIEFFALRVAPLLRPPHPLGRAVGRRDDGRSVPSLWKGAPGTDSWEAFLEGLPAGARSDISGAPRAPASLCCVRNLFTGVTHFATFSSLLSSVLLMLFHGLRSEAATTPGQR